MLHHYQPYQELKRRKKQTNIWTDIDEIYNKNQALAPNFWGQLILMMM